MVSRWRFCAKIYSQPELAELSNWIKRAEASVEPGVAGKIYFLELMGDGNP
jgi:hypothetical protein